MPPQPARGVPEAAAYRPRGCPHLRGTPVALAPVGKPPGSLTRSGRDFPLGEPATRTRTPAWGSINNADGGRPKEGGVGVRREGVSTCANLPTCRQLSRPTRRAIVLLSGLATLVMLTVNVPTSARAEPYRHAVPALLVTDAPASETVLPDTISPPTETAAERIAAPMIELAQPRPRRTRTGIQLASLGGSDIASAKRSSITGGAVRWGASPSCLDSRLRQVIDQVASIFGPVKVNSTCRSHSHNAKIGGATRSQHLTGDAADFSVSRNKPAVLGWLRRQPSVGGLKLYAGGRGHFHIDTGPRRTW